MKTRMRLKRILISIKEYKQLKKKSEIDYNLVNQVKKSLENIRHGKVTEWK